MKKVHGVYFGAHIVNSFFLDDHHHRSHRTGSLRSDLRSPSFKDGELSLVQVTLGQCSEIDYLESIFDTERFKANNKFYDALVAVGGSVPDLQLLLLVSGLAKRQALRHIASLEPWA